MKKIASYITAFLSAAILIAIDQISKFFAYNELAGKPSVELIHKILRLTYVQNSGAAWGIMAGKQYFFYILTIVLMLVLIFIYAITPAERKYRFFKLTLTGLFAGAIGNFIDRVLNGYVHDFIDFYCIDFPVFNFADMCITISMVLLIIAVCFKHKEGDFAYIKDFFSRKDKKPEDTNNE